MADSRHGEPGQPGEAGEAGKHGGGRGGAGGHGGRGGDAPHGWREALLLVTLLVVAVVSFYAVHNAQQIAAHEREDHAALAAECARVQHLRDRVNSNTAVIYTALEALQNHLSEDLEGKTGAARHVRVAGLHALDQATGALRLQPPTDCAAAIAHPDTYRPPAAVPVP
jgi:hypothetical protein